MAGSLCVGVEGEELVVEELGELLLEPDVLIAVEDHDDDELNEELDEELNGVPDDELVNVTKELDDGLDEEREDVTEDKLLIVDDGVVTTEVLDLEVNELGGVVDVLDEVIME